MPLVTSPLQNSPLVILGFDPRIQFHALLDANIDFGIANLYDKYMNARPALTIVPFMLRP